MRTAAMRRRGREEIPASMNAALIALEMIRETLPAATPGSWFNSATGYGTLGFGLPAALGAKLGAPGRIVVARSGDGGLQFSLAELASAIDAGAPVILLLRDNKGYGEIKSALIANGVPPIGVDLHRPDFAAIGSAYGCRTEKVECRGDLADALRRAAESAVPSMLLVQDRFLADC